MKINPKRLRNLRRRKKLSPKQLQAKSNISARHIQRLESPNGPGKPVRETTLLRLADALGVELAVLTGELPLPDPDETSSHREQADRVQISAWIESEARLAYALVGKRYGVKATAIINMAPLFFVLLAEGSLAWRREKLRDLDEAVDQMSEIGRGAGHLAFASCVWVAREGAEGEEKSIDNSDLFGEQVSEKAYDFSYNPSEENPFADYIRALACDLDNSGAIEVDPDGDRELGFGVTKNFPRYSVCRDELNKITDESPWAELALEWGYARLNEIPEELWHDDAAQERVKWLEAKVPDDIRNIRIDLPDLSSGGPDEGDGE